MRYRALLAAVAFAGTLVTALPAAAAPPIRIAFTVDETFASDFLSAVCGIPVGVHIEGAGTTTLFRDATGTEIIREFDILPGGLVTTYFSPVDLGGTGLSFRDVAQSPAQFVYPNGTDVGDEALVIINGVQRTTGPGSPRFVGHQVFEAVIIGVTSDGVPIADPVALLFQAGQFDGAAVLQARCASLGAP